MNNESRVSNSIKNISFGLIAQVIQMLLGFVSRTVFIAYLAIEYLGVNGLFTNILSLLSLAELGVGSAIIYSLYKPLADKDEKKMAALIQLFGKLYMIIALTIAVFGLLLFPFLDSIVDNPPAQIAKDLNIIYLLFLFNTVTTYFFYHKLSLFLADQKNHIVSKANTIVFIFQNIIQITVLIVFKNFIFYLAVQSIFQLLGNLYLSHLVNKYYPFLKKLQNEKVDSETKNKIYSNVKSTAIVKVGGLVVNNTSNIIVNYFSGLVLVGLLSNYVLLIGLASSLIIQVFAGITGSIAHVNVTESQEKKVATFHLVNFANFWIYGLASVMLLVLMNDFISLWIGSTFILPLNIVMVLTLNFYILGMQNAVWTFKSTFGLFKQGRLLILLTAAINLVLAYILGKAFGLLGILSAMAIARIITNVWYDPYIVFKLGLFQNPKFYFIKYGKYLATLTVSASLLFLIFHFVQLPLLWSLFFKVTTTFIVTNGMIYLLFRNEPEFIYLKNIALTMLSTLKSKIVK